ncbi:hypothetical protein BHE90_010447 [Fusarium euwallaceae]|uniref:Xylanolytic transcriptional activator regulatory domain-containing protein n=1 Tax=Fusarium euwallaceae TaxID=1147111 RepID=A0A430LHG5_9HYPO|nr:hypothetical protein BHE90_010447 [Fusarium euwallaceae]
MAPDEIQKPKKPSAGVSILAGATAGAVEISITYPFEFAKTRSQLNRHLPDSKKLPWPPFPSKEWYTGCTTLIIGNAVKAATRFVAYNGFRSLLADEEGKLNGPRTLMAGFAAGVAESTFAVTPFESIKTQLIDDKKKSNPRMRGFIHGSTVIARERGIRGFFQGFVPSTARQAANSAVRFTSYETLKGQALQWSGQEKLSSASTFIAGGLAGIITVYTTMPLDVVKTRMQSLEASRNYSNSIACAVSIFKNEGLKVFWSGALPRLGRLSLSGAIVFSVPTFSQIIELQRTQAALNAFIVKLRQSSPEERQRLLDSAVDEDGNVRVSPGPDEGPLPDHEGLRHLPRRPHQGPVETPIISSEDELDIAHFISVDDAGQPSSFGPSSALHNPARSETGLSPSRQSATQDNIRNGLIANAALQRHQEYGLARLPAIDGIPTELALHLLNLHWARQHHTFLLTYRPAVMRDLECSGPYCSNFMLNAIFACCSKFSRRPEVRDNPDDPTTAGRRFFRRCDELLARESLLTKPQVSTIVGLLLLGSTYNARGETSKGWLYTGYALRMVYDLGLHLDPKQTTDSAEEIEIRRRVFWGAFVCDKLQSLYLGRPVAINLRDSQVSREFLDLYEEKEPFLFPAISSVSSPGLPEGIGDAIPLHSVSTFQQLCMLSKIMTTIINRFYVVGATFSNAQNSLQQVDKALQQWRGSLSADLDFQPWLSPGVPVPRQPPNVMVLHNLYHSLIILVHHELCIANPGVAKPANIIRRLVEANKLDLMAEEAQTIDQSSFTFDLDAILNMFPANQGPDVDFVMPGYRMGLDYELPPDPLFGLMDGPAMSFDLETPMLL